MRSEGIASVFVGLRHVYGEGEALGGELGLVGGESGVVEVMDGDLVDLGRDGESQADGVDVGFLVLRYAHERAGDLLGGGRCVLDDALEAGLVDGIIGVGFRHDFISFLFADLFAEFYVVCEYYRLTISAWQRRSVQNVRSVISRDRRRAIVLWRLFKHDARGTV